MFFEILIGRGFIKAKQDSDYAKLKENLLIVFETKKNNKSVTSAVSEQIEPVMEWSTSEEKVFGVYFDDKEGIFIFKKIGRSPIKRYKNDLMGVYGKNNLEKLNLTDSKRDFLSDLPSFKSFLNNSESVKNPEKLKLKYLEPIDEENFTQFSLENLNRAQDKIKPVSNPHTLIVEFLTLKVFDEKEALKNESKNLQFFYKEDENIKKFRERIKKLYSDAKSSYEKVLSVPTLRYSQTLVPSSSADEKFLIALVKEFQRRTILNSKNNESFNQIIFNNFADKNNKAEKGQFFTPIPIVNHIIALLNPQKGETFCDPACGIADFLAMGFRHMHRDEITNEKFYATAENFYGFDTDKNALKLAELNLVLNGDGGAVLENMDSLGQKLLMNKKVSKAEEEGKNPAEFSIKNYFQETWENKNDELKDPQRYKIIATNPPFGKGRDLKTKAGNWDLPQETVEMYETYFEKSKKPDGTAGNLPNSMDMGVLFLENAYKLLEEGGRMGIVLSNSIASIKEWQNIRKWFLEKMRLVATFDLPSNTFGETGVATTVLIAYKPKHNEQYLLQNDYEVYVKEIKHTGYEVKTKQRIVHFEPQFIIDEETFEKTDELQEDFSAMQEEFQEFLKRQEREIKDTFGFNQ